MCFMSLEGHNLETTIMPLEDGCPNAAITLWIKGNWKMEIGRAAKGCKGITSSCRPRSSVLKLLLYLCYIVPLFLIV